MAKTRRSQSGPFDVAVQFEPRLITEHLGRDKYPTGPRALTELVANAFDADASRVDVDIHENDLSAVERVEVFDNGRGMTRVELTERFGLVGVRSESGNKIGRFGVGRWAVFRIGAHSRWRTVAVEADGARHRYSFDLDDAAPANFHVDVEDVEPDEPTGTWIEISRLYDSEMLREGRVSWDLAVQMCGYLLAHPQRHLRVNQKAIVIDFLIQERQEETIAPDEAAGITQPVKLTHLILRSPLAREKFPADLLLMAQGMTVDAIRLDSPPAPTYIGLAASPYFDDMVNANRAAFIEMDTTFAALREAVVARVGAYGVQLRVAQSETFIERARQKPYYPYRSVPKDSIEELNQQIYDATLEALNRASNLEIMKQQHQQIVFGLLHRALGNGDVLHVLSQVATLSDEEMAKFREVLERTTIQAVLELASQVQHRLDFLDMLQDLVYGEGADKLRERTHLHKYLENNAWIFGPQYHLATSDKGFRTVIERHREDAGLPAPSVAELAVIDGVAQIPDLFFVARKEYPANDGTLRRGLLVEIKRPKVDVGIEERNQLERYANVILDSGEFAGDRNHFDFFVVSSNIAAGVRRSLAQPQLPAGCFQQLDRARLFARTWGEIIESARAELHLVREHLRLRSLEMAAPEYFAKMFPHVRRKDSVASKPSLLATD